MVKSTEVDLIYRVQTGTNSNGDATTASRTINNFNPSVSDDDALEIAKGIASLQDFPFVLATHRTDKELADA